MQYVEASAEHSRFDLFRGLRWHLRGNFEEKTEGRHQRHSQSRVRARLLEAVGPNAGLAVALVPALGLLLEVAPEVPSEASKEVEARMLRTCLDILHVVVSPARPVVMVVDDLQ